MAFIPSLDDEGYLAVWKSQPTTVGQHYLQTQEKINGLDLPTSLKKKLTGACSRLVIQAAFADCFTQAPPLPAYTIGEE